MRQDFVVGLSLLGAVLCAPLTQTHAVTVAGGGEGQGIAVDLDRKIGGIESQQRAHDRSLDLHAAELHAHNAARLAALGCLKPAGRVSRQVS